MNKIKISKKDIAIIILGAISLVMMLAIIIMSKRRDRMISESLQNNSEISTDEVIANIDGDALDYLEITEVCSDKWIELHNKGTEPIDISNLKVKVADKLVATVEEKTIIAKDEYYVIEIEANPGTYDTNIISVLDIDNQVLRAFIAPKLNSNMSYGLCDPDKNIWGYMSPTKGTANAPKDMLYLESGGIGISAPGGFYRNEFELELICKDNEKIYYTTDSTTPTIESTLYESPILIKNNSGSTNKYAQMAVYNRLVSEYFPGTIDAGCVVKAIKVDSSGNITGSMSQAYFVGLANDSDYLNMPVISITTDPINLFDYEQGIYVAGKEREDAMIQGLRAEFYANYYNPWKKAATIEYYEPSKDKTFEIDAQINIVPNEYSPSRQKDFLITFEDNTYEKYNGSSILSFISTDGELQLTQNYQDNTLKIRTKFGEALTDDTDIGVETCQPCVLFLDGEYWGLYTIRQKFDQKYFERRYGVTQEITTHSSEEYNEFFAGFIDFVLQNDLSVDANYEQVNEMMDVDNFIDFICFNVFIGNSEFYPSKMTAWRTISEDGQGMEDGRWRFLSEDLSNSMYLTSMQTPTINTFLQVGIQSDGLVQSLLMNDEFCTKLESRMKQLASGPLSSENCDETIESIAQLLKKPAVASFRRYFGSYSERAYLNEIQKIKDYFSERKDYILKYTHDFVQTGGDLERAIQMSADTQDDTSIEMDEENGQENNEQDIEGTLEEDSEINSEEVEENING